MIGVIAFIALALLIFLYRARRKKEISEYTLPAGAADILRDNVAFYRELDEGSRRIFEERVRDFLARTSVRGVGTEIDDLDRLLVASGAIIPIFAFPDWRYNNISEVLLYDGAFTRDFNTTGKGRDVAGMVGDGAMHRQMILSRPALRQSFSNENDGRNVAIHEFAHLLDKADGSVDGIPEYLLTNPGIIPWVRMIRETITDMRTKGAPDIDHYGATNEAEFFAVISEYFFERPEQLRGNHPELYALLERVFLPTIEKE